MIKKKVIAILLCMILCLTVLQVAAFAGEGPAAVVGGSPFTGDESNVGLWIGVAVAALAAIAGIVFYLVKRRK